MALTCINKDIENSASSYDTFQPSFVNAEDALTDFDGKTNTGFILTENGRLSHQGDTTYAAPYAKSYIFPDGVTTNGYILSVGQWNEVALYAEEVCNCLIKVGGIGIDRNNWTSTYVRNHSSYPVYYWCRIDNSYNVSFPSYNGYRGIYPNGAVPVSVRVCTDYVNKNPTIIR